MRRIALIGNLLASSVAFAIAALLAGQCLADEQVIKWRAHPELVLARSSTNCGDNFREPINIAFDGKVVKTTAWTRMSYDLVLFEPLAADGSGQVYGVSMPRNSSVVVEFEPGHGPRRISYWSRYWVRCVWSFRPLDN
jgi:hypothetical protein